MRSTGCTVVHSDALAPDETERLVHGTEHVRAQRHRARNSPAHTSTRPRAALHLARRTRRGHDPPRARRRGPARPARAPDAARIDEPPGLGPAATQVGRDRWARHLDRLDGDARQPLHGGRAGPGRPNPAWTDRAPPCRPAAGRSPRGRFGPGVRRPRGAREHGPSRPTPRPGPGRRGDGAAALAAEGAAVGERRRRRPPGGTSWRRVRRRRARPRSSAASWPMPLGHRYLVRQRHGAASPWTRPAVDGAAQAHETAGPGPQLDRGVRWRSRRRRSPSAEHDVGPED